MGDPKLLAKARRSPAGLTIEQVVRLLRSFGFTCVRGRRGHWIARHGALAETIGIAEPHPEKHVAAVYVRMAVKAIEALPPDDSDDQSD